MKINCGDLKCPNCKKENSLKYFEDSNIYKCLNCDRVFSFKTILKLWREKDV